MNNKTLEQETCPKCGGDIRHLGRITGYLSELDKWNQAKVNEYIDRVDHILDNDN